MSQLQEKTEVRKISMGHRAIHTEIIIDAAPEQVWAVLTDTESYPEWSRIMLKMDGKIVDGGKIDVLFQANEKRKPTLFHNTLHVHDGKEFYWSEVRTAGVRDRHAFRVEPTGDGKTRFIQSDIAKGGLTWLLGGTITNMQAKIYPIFNRCLKAEVEKRYPRP